MFVRVKEVRANGRKYRYLHIVENLRDGDRVRQRIVGSLGRLDELEASGDLEQVIRQLVDHCPAVRILRAEAAGTLQVERDRSWGPVLIFERLWEELGLKDLIGDIAKRRHFDFDMERMAFAQVLQRLVAPGSDLAGSKWIKTVEAEGFSNLQLMHFYKSLSFLWKRKDEIEQALFRRGLDLFNHNVDLVFFDTSSTYFEGTSLEGWAKLGKSKDHRPDHLQLVIGVVMRADGFPVACEIWPGNMADVKTIKPIVEGLKGRFGIRDVVLVCDRGMVSKENLQLIRDEGYHYIVGVKMRGVVEVRDEVIGAAGRYHLVNENLRVKEVHVEDRRYVVCFNPEEAAKDRHDREALIAKIEEKLKKGGVSSLINNRGYRRFLKVAKGSATIDRKKAEEDARYDGKYVLRTTTDLPADEVALAYKQLTWIERLWRELKDVMEVRPIYHWRKRDNVKGHIFVSFLSLYLAALLRRRITEAGEQFQWDEIIRDLSEVRAVVVQLDGQSYRLRSPAKGCAGAVFQAIGVKLPALAEPAP